MIMKGACLMLVGVIGLCLSSCDANNLPGKIFYLSLPTEEREDFLVFSLGDGYSRNSSKLSRTDFPFPDALGIDLELLEKFQNLTAPENFTINLYVWVKARYNMDQQSLRHLILRRTVCLPNGTCIDMSDVGGMCCPF